MTHTIIYTCDVCKKPVTEMYGVLRVTVRGEKEPDVNADLELCSLSCLEDWVIGAQEVDRG